MEGLVINTNSASSMASANLAANNKALKGSLLRLSSGSKINSPGDDAGGLAVSTKMEAALKRNMATQNNIGNAVSFLQTQDGALDTISEVLQRVSELKILHSDETKNTTDKANYDAEFTQLKLQLTNLAAEKFNGVAVFGTALAVSTSEDGAQSVAVAAADVATPLGTIDAAASLADFAIADTTTAIEAVATLRATNGALQNSLEFSANMLVTNKINLEAANSRIKDTDIAEESTTFAKKNILTQASAAMLAQANASPQVALQLIG